MSVLFKSVNVSFLCVLYSPVAFSFIRDVPEYKDHQNKNKKKNLVNGILESDIGQILELDIFGTRNFYI